MRCSNCGGELIFKDSIGICCSCGKQQKIENAFENTEVCICYLENDENGRRTKDSIIAGEVYKKLESKNTSTFYEHISAANIVGDDLETIRHTAIFHAKIIIIIGTTTSNFSYLYEKFSKDFVGKKIIPLISGMKPENLPNELKCYQVSNFDNVGALNDLTISVLNLLGRGKEVELEDIYNKKVKSKKILIAVISSVVAALICMGFVLGFIFMPKDEEIVLTDNDIYNNAVTLLNEEKYLEAAKEFNKIPQFKDSSNQIKRIYDRYDGYYQTEDKLITFHISISDKQTTSISFEKSVEGKKVDFEGSSKIVDNIISFSFDDNFSNRGRIEVILKNNNIGVQTTVENNDNKISIGNNNLTFDLSMKTDKPEDLKVTKELVLNWLNKKTCFKDLTDLGFELEFIGSPYITERDSINSLQEYKIINTDIRIYFASFDYKTQNLDVNEVYDIEWNETEACLIGISLPVKTIYPELVGKTNHISYENGVLLTSGGFVFNMSELAVYKSDTLIAMTSDVLIGKEKIQDCINEIYIDEFLKNCGNSAYDNYLIYDIEMLSIKNNSALICVREEVRGYYIGKSIYNDIYYKMDLSTYNCELIIKFNNLNNSDPNFENWKSHPENFSEFL